MQFRIITGSDNLQSGSTKFHVFHAPSHQRPGAEKFLSQLAKDKNPEVPVSTGRMRKVSAVAGFPDEMGVWWEAMFELPDGLVMKVWAAKSTGGRMEYANTWIKVRSGAPLRRCAVSTTQHSGAAYNEVLVEGRFDYLSFTDLKIQGVAADQRDVMNGMPDKVRAMFRDTILEHEIEKRSVLKSKIIVDTDGNQQKMHKIAARRAVKL
jgi:hypothetical protein